MAANATITLADGKSTPENHAFDPVRIQGDVAMYANFSESYSDGRETLQFSLGGRSGLRKVSVKTHFPRVVDETVNGVTVSRKVDWIDIITTVFVPSTWDKDDITDARVIHSNALQNALVLDAVDEGKFVW